MVCEICGHEFVGTCKRCNKRVKTWGVDGVVLLMKLAQRTDDIHASEIAELIDQYYVGKALARSDKANVARMALRILGYRGNIIGRIHINQVDYNSTRKREYETALRWRLKKDDCERCGGNEGLRVHHIVPIAWGGLTSEDNCVTLCEKCHREVHRKLSLSLNRTLLLKYLEPYKDEIENLARSSFMKM